MFDDSRKSRDVLPQTLRSLRQHLIIERSDPSAIHWHAPTHVALGCVAL